MTAAVNIILACDWADCATSFGPSSHGYAMNTTTIRGARGYAERNGWGVQHLANNRHTKRSTARDGDDLCPQHYRQWRLDKGLPVTSEPDTLFDERPLFANGFHCELVANNNPNCQCDEC